MARFHSDMDALEMRAPDGRAARDRVDRPHHRAGRPAARVGQRLPHARHRVLRRVDVSRATASCRTTPKSRWSGSPARAAAIPTTRTAANRSTSCCGSRRSPTSPRGARRSASAGPGWHIECSAMAMHEHGPTHRPARRRHRPDLPAPRVRDRAEREPHGQAVRHALAALGDGQLRGREDVEVARQPRVRRRAAEDRRPARDPARADAPPLPPRLRVVPHRSRRGHRAAAPAARGRGASDRSRPAPFAQRVRDAIDDDLDTPRALDALDDLAERDPLRRRRPERAHGVVRARAAARRRPRAADRHRQPSDAVAKSARVAEAGRW